MTKSKKKKCATCKGTGFVRYTEHEPGMWTFTGSKTCRDCGGTGKER